jgi:hypothetical protein
VRSPPSLLPSEWRIPGPHAVGNAIFQAHTPPQGLTPTEAASIGAVARTVRASITAAREYAHIKRMVAVLEPIWRKQSEEALGHQFWPGEGEGRFVVNSMPKCVAGFSFGLVFWSMMPTDDNQTEPIGLRRTSGTVRTRRARSCTAPSLVTRASSRRRP